MPNGLCQNRGFSSAPGQEAEPWTHFYRVYCANANWEGCLDVCRDGVCCFSPFVAMHVAGCMSFRANKRLESSRLRLTIDALRRNSQIRVLVLWRQQRVLFSLR